MTKLSDELDDLADAKDDGPEKNRLRCLATRARIMEYRLHQEEVVPHPHEGELQAFAERIREGGPCQTTPAEESNVIRMCGPVGMRMALLRSLARS